MSVHVATKQTAPSKHAEPHRSTQQTSCAAYSAPSPVRRLQRAIGNRAMSSLMRSPVIQPKLTLSEPDDVYEREADRVADQVMRAAETGEEEERLGDGGRRDGRNLIFHTKPANQPARPALDGQVQRRTGTPEIQRACEVTPPPASMTCQPATSSTGSGTNILFGLDSSNVSAADKATVSAIAAAWHRGGRVATLRVAGFASCDGPASSNWQLSCRRAQTVALELEAPSDGTPGVATTNLEVLANGETDQFARNLPPNRRVVITSGGTPPPGPACALSISGPTQVDHYCAAYVRSEETTCGVFPAPNITLSVSGATAGATLRWNITRGSSRASIVGRTDNPTVTIKGDAPSVTRADVTVQVTDGSCTATQFITVRQPTFMPAATVASSGPSFVQLMVTYTVQDQFGTAMGANICWDETVTTCSNTHPGGSHAKGDIGTTASGQVTDQLRVETTSGSLPSGLCTKFNQTITVGGCGPLARNTIVFQNSGASLNQNASCVAGDPCP